VDPEEELEKMVPAILDRAFKGEYDWYMWFSVDLIVDFN